MTELILLLMIGLAIWFVADSLKARELAHAAAARACRDEAVQFLDDTVSQSALALRRDDMGTLRIERRFVFEFSNSGDDRQQGNVRVLGNEVKEVRLARLWLVES